MGKLKRVRDWRSRLNDVVEKRRREPFSDENNCGVFIGDCIYAMTGVDVIKPFRGQYKTLAEAIILLREAGYADGCAFLAEHFDEIPPALARSGDLMAFPSEESGWAGGVVNGEKVTVLSRAGIGNADRTADARAFQIPEA